VLSQQYDGWDLNYLKTEAKARYFMPLGDTGIVASVKGQAGIINNFGAGQVSATDAFKSGSQLVRGFEECLKANIQLVTTQLEPRLVLSKLLVSLLAP